MKFHNFNHSTLLINDFMLGKPLHRVQTPDAIQSGVSFSLSLPNGFCSALGKKIVLLEIFLMKEIYSYAG